MQPRPLPTRLPPPLVAGLPALLAGMVASRPPRGSSIGPARRHRAHDERRPAARCGDRRGPRLPTVRTRPMSHRACRSRTRSSRDKARRRPQARRADPGVRHGASRRGCCRPTGNAAARHCAQRPGLPPALEPGGRRSARSSPGTPTAAAWTASGRTVSPILGPVLDGAGDFAAIRDTDDGRSTATAPGTARWDRCSSSRRPGRSEPRRQRRRPQRPARHRRRGAGVPPATCAPATATSAREGDRRRAVFSYNHSWDYVDLVLAWADAYATGTPPATVQQVGARDDRDGGDGGGGGATGRNRTCLPARPRPLRPPPPRRLRPRRPPRPRPRPRPRPPPRTRPSSRGSRPPPRWRPTRPRAAARRPTPARTPPVTPRRPDPDRDPDRATPTETPTARHRRRPVPTRPRPPPIRPTSPPDDRREPGCPTPPARLTRSASASAPLRGRLRARDHHLAVPACRRSRRPLRSRPGPGPRWVLRGERGRARPSSASSRPAPTSR